MCTILGFGLPERETCYMLPCIPKRWYQLSTIWRTRQSDVRPEACGTSYQTNRTQNIFMLFINEAMAFLLSLSVCSSIMLSFPLTTWNQLSTKKDRFERWELRIESGSGIFLMVVSNIFVLSYALTYSNQLSTSRRLDLRQRLVSNDCKSLVFHIWQAGVATMSCCHGIQVFYLRNSWNFHKNVILVRIKAW